MRPAIGAKGSGSAQQPEPDVPGIGNLSWLTLSITRKGFGPQAIAFDSLDKYQLTSAEWRIYEIVADVPQDADVISYGLALMGDGKAWLDSVSVVVMDPPTGGR